MTRAAILLLGSLWVLCAAGCYRANPRYCDDQIACPAGMVCGPLLECVPADGGVADLAGADQHVQPPPDLRRPDPDLALSCPTCTCRPDRPEGCACGQGSGCRISCGDDCHEELRCTQSTSCTIQCGDRCQASCIQSSCVIIAGAGAEVLCNQTNPCTVTAGAGSLVRCLQATCTVTCSAGNKLECPNGVTVCGRGCP